MTLRSELSFALSMGQYELARIIATAPARYKVYPIAKRSGGPPRIIAQPAKELKEVQHVVLERVLSRFPVHDCAMAYVKNRNIRDNASRHVGAKYLMKLDFSNFFNTITVRDFRSFIKHQHIADITSDDTKDLERIIFWSGEKNSSVPRKLSIGAPSSPTVSNILLYGLDVIAAEKARDIGVVYTRYADDIVVSGDDRQKLNEFETHFRKSMKELRHPKLQMNESKRGIYGPGQRHFVTGLVVTPAGEISLGRARKREISALLHKSKLGELDGDLQAYLKGMLGFAAANEPTLLTRMREKYGGDVLDAAMRYVVPPKVIRHQNR